MALGSVFPMLTRQPSHSSSNGLVGKQGERVSQARTRGQEHWSLYRIVLEAD